MDPLRQQILEYWAHLVTTDQPTALDVGNKYRTKKILLRAHGMQTYYDIDFESKHQALSHEIIELTDSHPLQNILDAPQMIGILGPMAENKGEVNVIEEVVKPDEKMEEDMFFEQHFTKSLSDTLGGLQKKSNPFDFNS